MKRLFVTLVLIFGCVGLAEAQTTLTNDMTWGAVPEAASYVVQRDTDGGGFVDVATVTAPTVTYQDAGLPLGAIYTWRVFSKKASGVLSVTSSPTCTTDATPPAAPSSLACSVSLN